MVYQHLSGVSVFVSAISSISNIVISDIIHQRICHQRFCIPSECHSQQHFWSDIMAIAPRHPF